MKNILLKTIIERRWFMMGWSFGFIAFAALMVTFYPAMHMDGAIDALLANMPKAFEGLVGDLADLQSFPSYIASQLFDIRLPLIAGIMAIILGQSLSTAEEERGELRTMLALPVGRAMLLFQKWLALVVITGVTVAALYAGIAVTAPFVDDAAIDTIDLLRLLAMTWLLMVTYGTIAFGVGSITGNKGAATAISIFVIIGSFILSTFGQAVDWLADYEWLSLIHYFPAVEVVNEGIQIADAGILGALTILILIITFVVFRSRDIH